MSADAAPLTGPSAGLAKPMRIVLFVLLAVLCLLALSMIGRFGRGDRSTGYEPPAPRIASAAALQPLMMIEDGRRKPLDSYARNTLLRYSGRERYAGQPAIDWLARVLLSPQETYRDEVFLIDHPEVLEAIGVPSRGRGRYSFEELRAGAIELEELAALASELAAEERSLVQREIIRVWNKPGRVSPACSPPSASPTPTPRRSSSTRTARRRPCSYREQGRTAIWTSHCAVPCWRSRPPP